jgi:hypothetical protein
MTTLCDDSVCEGNDAACVGDVRAERQIVTKELVAGMG